MDSTREPSHPSRRFRSPYLEILRLDLSRRGKGPIPRPIENRDSECKRIVARLHSIVREHRASARRIGTPLGDTILKNILKALVAESYGNDFRPFLRSTDPVESFLCVVLFDDLLELPGNILFTSRSGTGATRYSTMESSRWRDCLNELAQRLDLR